MSIIDIIMQNLNLFLTIVLFVVGWIFGRMNEQQHLKELTKNELLLGHIIISNERLFQPQLDPRYQGSLVVGNVVIAQDYFKMTIAGILSIFGKNLTTFETLLERARREAVVRLKDEANRMGYNQVYGLRFETTEVLGGVEVLAYGTAVLTINNAKVPPALQKF